MRYSGAFFEQDEITKFTKVELQECENNLKAYRDWYSVTKTDFGKGKAKGKEEGRAECETNKAREIALELISNACQLISSQDPQA